MANGVALDFSRREDARRDAFSRVWASALDAVFSDVAPYYDIASEVASLGLCSRWRRRFVDEIDAGPGERVLDVCAGTNGVGIALLRRQPDLRITAMDRSRAMQKVGRRLAGARGFEIDSVIGDAHRLPFPDSSFDVVTLQWASRHLAVVDVFTEVRRVLRPGGRFHHCDMLRPAHPGVAAAYGAYLWASLSATAIAFGSSREAWACRDYFVRAIDLFYSADELSALLAELGFAGISSEAAPGGVIARHRAVRV